MNGLARVVLIGNLTRDPELRSTQSGLSVGSFSVAVNGREKRGDSWEDYVSFYDVTVFGKQAENANQYLSKGSPVAIDGRLRQDRWENNDGQKRSAVKVIAETVNFLPSGERQGNGSKSQSDLGGVDAAYAAREDVQRQGADHPLDDGGEIPFDDPADRGYGF
jgi:single-strand DNA-binding protein